MAQYNAKNEKLKKKYFNYLKEAKQLSPSTITSVAKAIHRFEEFNNFDDLSKFSKDKAVGFKRALTNTKNKAKNQPLSKSTILHTLNPLKDFYKWLAGQTGYKSKISYPDVEYFNLSEKESREAKTVTYKDFPSVEKVIKVINSIDTKNEIAKRNQALIAFTLLTGIRDGVLIGLKIKHIDLENKLVKQDPREVKTKFSKYISTYFCPIGDDVEKIFFDYVNYLKAEKLFDANSPLFPKTLVIQDAENSFKEGGLSKEHWQSASAIREIFKNAFINAGFEYFNPHSFRKTITQLGEKICKTPEDFKAWSQNLGHESPLTTFTSYGQVSTYRQGEIIKGLIKNPNNENEDKLSEALKILKEIQGNKNN
jgi:integrase/recombinase XerD